MKYLIASLIAALFVSSPSFAKDKIEESAPEEPSAVRLDPAAEMAMVKKDAERVKQAPVWPAFVKLFNECRSEELKSCEPFQVWSFFRPAHESCSGQGRNLNWKSIECTVNGKKKILLADSKEFSTIALCMKSKNSRKANDGTFVMYREPGEGIRSFREFALFSVGCTLSGNKKAW